VVGVALHTRHRDCTRAPHPLATACSSGGVGGNATMHGGSPTNRTPTHSDSAPETPTPATNVTSSKTTSTTTAMVLSTCTIGRHGGAENAFYLSRRLLALQTNLIQCTGRQQWKLNAKHPFSCQGRRLGRAGRPCSHPSSPPPLLANATFREAQRRWVPPQSQATATACHQRCAAFQDPHRVTDRRGSLPLPCSLPYRWSASPATP